MRTNTKNATGKKSPSAKASSGKSQDAPDRKFQNVQDQAYQAIRSALLAGRYYPGDKLSIRQIAFSLGLSDTPVRESLLRLAAEGVISMEPYRSARVPLLDTTEIKELWMIRQLLEGRAAAEAATASTKDDMTELTGIELQLDRARKAGDSESIASLNSTFHLSLYRASRLNRLCTEIERLWLCAAPVMRLQMQNRRLGGEEGQGRHATILKALRARDAAGLEAAVVNDIELAGETIFDALSQIEA